MCSLCPDGTIYADLAPTLRDEISALQKELRRERRKNVELEVICRELNQDNDNYLNIAVQLEGAVENLLVALSLPTHSLYGLEVTDYNALLRLINDETPRLKTLISGLDVLASLAVGLNRSVETCKGQIRTLQDDVSRLESEKASIRRIQCENLALHQRPQPPLQLSRNEDYVKAISPTGHVDFTTTGRNQTLVSAVAEVLPVVVSVASGQTQSKRVKIVQPLKTRQESDTDERSQRNKSGVSVSMGGRERPLGSSRHWEPTTFNIFDISTSPDTFSRCEIQCAICVEGHSLAGNPFCYHPGWQIHFSSNTQLEHPFIGLSFGLVRASPGKLGKNEKVKGFGLMWKLCREDSFDVREVKAYEPASLRDLPLALTELCADKYVRRTLWRVSLFGKFDSPPAHSRRILENLDEDMKNNLKALFRPGGTKQIDIWFVNPKDGDQLKRKIDTDALLALQSLR